MNIHTAALLRERGRLSEASQHVVDYSMDLDAMIHAGCYDKRDDKITAERFPIVGEGQIEFEDMLCDFYPDPSTVEVLKFIQEIDPANKWMPGRIENLLAFGTKNPKRLRYPILALGFVDNFYSGLVPIIQEGSSKPSLTLNFRDGGPWHRRCRFLVVRKKIKN